MIVHTLVQSALKTGCLSVASEALMRQVLEIQGYQKSEVEALTVLYEAVKSGKVEREAHDNRFLSFPFLLCTGKGQPQDNQLVDNLN